MHKMTVCYADWPLDIEPGMITEFDSHHSEIDNHPFERLGSKLLDALMEHEPALKQVIEAWEIQWSKFQRALAAH